MNKCQMLIIYYLIFCFNDDCESYSLIASLDELYLFIGGVRCGGYLCYGKLMFQLLGYIVNFINAHCFLKPEDPWALLEPRGVRL